MLAAPGAGRENRQFELGAALWFTLGDRRLIDKTLPAATALQHAFDEADPPFPGGERHAMSCVHLYRVTRDPRHLALAKHYLDIRCRAASPGRSRHTQSSSEERRVGKEGASKCRSRVLADHTKTKTTNDTN